MTAPNKFTPVQRSPGPPQKQANTRGDLPIIPVILILLYAAYLGVAIVAPLFIGSLADWMDGIMPPLFRVIGAAVLFGIFGGILFYLTFFAHVGSSPVRNPAPEQRRVPTSRPPDPGRFRPVANAGSNSPKGSAVQENKNEKGSEKKKIEKQKETPAIISYPLEVEGGIYGDTYIKLSDKKLLKLRSMVVEPELLA